MGRLCKNVSSLSLIVIALVGVQLNWLNLFHFVILEEGLLAILIDVIKMSMPAVFFLTKIDFVILCTYNALL